MSTGLRAWWRRLRGPGPTIDPALWQLVTGPLPLLAGLSDEEGDRLRVLSARFLDRIAVEGAGEFAPPDGARVEIAAQACVPILELGLDYYRDLRSIVVYPGAFVARHRYRDEAGIEHDLAEARAGEAWDVGPVLLSWEDVRADRHAAHRGANVVIHEMAHKLDGLNGATNGYPPLHADMQREVWTETFTAAYEALERCITAGRPAPLDPYALTSPAEFFAVGSETFFTAPHALRAGMPALYRQLAAFYRQDPAARLPVSSRHPGRRAPPPGDGHAAGGKPAVSIVACLRRFGAYRRPSGDQRRWCGGLAIWQHAGSLPGDRGGPAGWANSQRVATVEKGQYRV